MPAYVMANIQVNDPQAYSEYTAKVPGTVDKYGGHFIVRGGEPQVKEGSPLPRVVVIEFPSVEQANTWYHSPEYQAILPIRQRTARTSFLVIVPGV
jgi:uncharacterized protein (DUF1330 family)